MRWTTATEEQIEQYKTAAEFDDFDGRRLPGTCQGNQLKLCSAVGY